MGSLLLAVIYLIFISLLELAYKKADTNETITS